MPRYFQYTEPGDDGEPVLRTITDEEILRDYFPWWAERMRQAGKAALISPAACVEDFCVVHWAVEREC